MNDEKTPIPLRASRKQAEPKPLTFPQPDRHINVVQSITGNKLQDVALRNYIHQEITKALYAIGNYDPEPNIATMTYDEFEAFMAQVWEEE